MPVDYVSDLLSAPGLYAPARRRSGWQPTMREQLGPPDPEEQAGLLERIGTGTLGTLGFIGGSLNKPGRFIRNIASGLTGGRFSASELLGLIPFSDSIGLTDASQEVTGSELIGNERHPDLFSAEGAAGIATEIALDPLTYIGLGPWTKFGKALGKTGATSGMTLSERLAGFGTTRGVEEAARATAASRGLTGAVHGPLLPGQLAEAALTMPRVGEAARALNPLPHNFVPMPEDVLKAVKQTGGTQQAEEAARKLLGGPTMQGPLTPLQLAEGGRTLPGIEAIAKSLHAPTWSEISGVLDKPLSGLVSVGFPFLPKAILGEGAAGLKVLDTLGKIPGVATAAKLTEPTRRYLGAQFDYSKRGLQEKIGQEVAGENTRRFENVLRVQAEDQLLDVARKWQAAKMTKEDAGFLRLLAEDIPAHQWEHDASRKWLQMSPQKQQIITETAKDTRVMLDSELAWRKSIGLDPRELEDAFASYFPRRLAGEKVSNLSTGRDDIFRNFAGGSEGVAAMFRDDGLRNIVGGPGYGAGDTHIAKGGEYIRENYLGWDKAKEAQYKTLSRTVSEDKVAALQKSADRAQAIYDAYSIGGGQATQSVAKQTLDTALQDLLKAKAQLADLEHMRGAFNQSLRLASEIKGTALKKGEFWNGAWDDLHNHMVNSARVRANAEGVLEVLRRSDGLMSPLDQAGKGYVPVLDTLAKAGFGKGGKMTPEATEAIARQLNMPVDQLKLMHLDPKIAEDIVRFQESFQLPKAMAPVVKLVDQFTNLFKTGVTQWPGKWMRDLTGGFYQTMIGGTTASAGDAYKLYRGGTIKGANKLHASLANLTDEQATRAVGDMFHSHGLFGGASSLTQDITGIGGKVGQSWETLLGPGVKQAAPWESGWRGLKQLATDVWNIGDAEARSRLAPWNVAGVATEKNLFSPAIAGREIEQMTETIPRLTSFIGFLKKGYDPLGAALQTKALHYDYSRLSSFEREFMRRVVPFYSWVRLNTPFVVGELMRNPGGIMAQSVRGAVAAKGSVPFVPAQLGEGMAIPLGSEEGGKQSFLGTLGLPFEDLSQVMTGRGLLGSINPLFKLPAELLTNRQFFSGRELRDIQPQFGATAIDTLLANSPMSRFISTGRQAANPNIGWGGFATGFLTGARVSNIDMEGARNAALRNFINDETAGSPRVGQLSRPYVRSGVDPSTLTDEERQLLQMQAILDARSRQQRSQRGGR